MLSKLKNFIGTLTTLVFLNTYTLFNILDVLTITKQFITRSVNLMEKLSEKKGTEFIKILYKTILHGSYAFWMFLWVLLIYFSAFDISGSRDNSDFLRKFLLIMFLFCLWTGSYIYQFKSRSWLSILIGNVLSLVIAFLTVQYLIPFLYKVM